MLVTDGISDKNPVDRLLRKLMLISSLLSSIIFTLKFIVDKDENPWVEKSIKYLSNIAGFITILTATLMLLRVLKDDE
mgnify:CR=1 FL=1